MSLLATMVLGFTAALMAAPQKPAAGKAATKDDSAKQEAKVPGFVINRANGGFLSLQVEDGHFKLAFYDAKKKPAKADVARATARWVVHYKIGDERTVLNPNEDGTALTSPQFVRPPYNFRLYLSLFVDDNDNAAEHYVLDFRQ